MGGFIGGLLIFGFIIYTFVAFTGQSGINERLTDEGKQRAKNNNQLVYYDQKERCYRSVKTNEKAQRFIAHDVNGESFEYVLTLPPFATITHGRFIEARYLNVNKWNEPVKFDDNQRKMFFGN